MSKSNKKKCPLKFGSNDRYCDEDCAWFDGIGCGVLDISITGAMPKPTKTVDDTQLERLISSFTNGLRQILK